MFLAIKELTHGKLKFSLLTLIIFLITFLVLFITGLANGLANEGKSAISDTSIQNFVLQKESNNRISRSEIAQTDIEKIDNKKLTPLSINQRTIQKNKNSNNKVDISFFAIDFNDFLSPTVSKGNSVSNDSDQSVVVSEKLSGEGYKIGDYITDTASKTKLKIIGFTKDKSYSHSPVIYINFKENKKITFQKNTVNTLVSDKTISNIKGFDIIDKNTIIQNIPGYKEEQSSLLMMIGFLYVISIIVLGVFFYIITLEKIPQLGTLKAIGASTKYLARSLISQVTIITIFSLIISSILISVMGAILPSSMPFSLSLSTLFVTDLLFIAIAIASTIFSLIKINKIDPISAIGGN